jgi:RNA polymerase sigma-70 factor (ECF subfamily)
MPISPQTTSKLDDEELLTLVGQRDQVAFEAFYDRFERQAFSLAYRIIGERSAAEDTVQEGFLSIWKSGERYDSTRGSAGAWARGSVRKRAIDTLRSRASRTPTLDSDDDGILESRPGEDRTDELAFRRETQREVQEVIADLPDKQSKVIKLAFYGGFSQSEISEMLELPLGTVKGRMRLGLEKLRGGLSDEGKVTV